MMLLVKIAELVIVFLVIRSLVRFLKPAEQRKTASKKPTRPPERFDESSHDISDADYEDL